MAEQSMTFTRIESDESLKALSRNLMGCRRVFIDTEFESRREGTTLCLVQISDGETIYLVDPFAMSDLRPIGEPLGDPSCEWVVHAGKQDLALLEKAFGLEEDPALFDTQVAWSMVSAEFQVSLAYLEALFFNKRPEKGRQTDDWMRRPLPPEQLAYAAADVALLPKLYGELRELLEALNRRPFVEEVTYETYFPPKPNDRNLTLKSFRNLWELDNRQREALEFLIRWSNEQSVSRNGATPNRKTLLSIARRMPLSIHELCEIKGVNRRWGSRDGHTIVDAITEIIATRPLVDEERVPEPYASFDELYTDAWFQCAKAEVCASAKIAPELAFPSWLAKTLRARLDDEKPFASAGELFTGWRSFLGDYWRAFCAETMGK